VAPNQLPGVGWEPLSGGPNKGPLPKLGALPSPTYGHRRSAQEGQLESIGAYYQSP
jgi:hypothetical protein